MEEYGVMNVDEGTYLGFVKTSKWGTSYMWTSMKDDALRYKSKTSARRWVNRLSERHPARNYTIIAFLPR